LVKIIGCSISISYENLYIFLIKENTKFKKFLRVLCIWIFIKKLMEKQQTQNLKSCGKTFFKVGEFIQLYRKKQTEFAE